MIRIVKCIRYGSRVLGMGPTDGEQEYSMGRVVLGMGLTDGVQGCSMGGVVLLFLDLTDGVLERGDGKSRVLYMFLLKGQRGGVLGRVVLHVGITDGVNGRSDGESKVCLI